MIATEPPLLETRGLEMRWPKHDQSVLRSIDLTVRAGELTVLLGSNGSGKSTLLKCLVQLLRPTAGQVYVGDNGDVTRLGGRALERARRDLALVTQHANLVRRRSVVANVVCGSLGRHTDWRTRLGGLPPDEGVAAMRNLETVGLAHLANRRASTLSGGQAQRVSVARALQQRPRVLLADEPVASLDPDAAEEMLTILKALANRDGLGVLAVLHQPDLTLRYADRVIGMRAGSIVFDEVTPKLARAQIAALYGGAAPAA